MTGTISHICQCVCHSGGPSHTPARLAILPKKSTALNEIALQSNTGLVILLKYLVSSSQVSNQGKAVQCGRGLSIYYAIQDRGRGLPDLLQYYIGGGLPNLLQYYIGGVLKVYYNITVLKGKWKVIILFQL